jgi:hypothetical protein
MSKEISARCSVVTQSEHTLIGKIEKYFVVCGCDVRSMPASSLFTKEVLGKGELSFSPAPSSRQLQILRQKPLSYTGNIHPSGKGLGALTTHTYIVLPHAGSQKHANAFLIGSQEGVLLIHVHFPKNRFWIPLQAVSV